MRLRWRWAGMSAALVCFVASAGASLEVATKTAETAPPTFRVEALARSRELIRYMQTRQQRPSGSSKSKRLQAVPESTVIEYFQSTPEALKASLDTVVRDLSRRSLVVDPTKHVRLLPPRGRSGYEDLRIFVSHPYHLRGNHPGGENVAAADLGKVWREFIRSAKNEIILNVYEFNFDGVADELIQARARGLRIRLGVDAREARRKPENRAMVARLRSKGIEVIEVDSAGLNHQKMVAIDWTDETHSRVLFSSGNLTRSCLDPAGDLGPSLKVASKVSEKAKALSIPNANHVITMKSWLAANLVHHELTKTFSTELKLRGAKFPATGSYQITGPGVDPQTFEAYPAKSFIIAFTPGGAFRKLGGVNRNILAHILRKADGPIRLVQFSFSSPDVLTALLERAERDLQRDGRFDFESVGDTSGALQGWSGFLQMSALKRENVGRGKSKRTRFIEDEKSPWMKAFTPDQLARLRSNIRIAPAVYGQTSVWVDGKRREVSAKIHHKLMSIGDFAIVGTSFNFSKNAESNNEQVLLFHDPAIASVVRAIAAELAQASAGSVYDAATLRMAKFNSKPRQDLESEFDDDAFAD